MPLHIKSPQHAHEAIFLSLSPAHLQAASQLTWTSNSIHVPSHSILNVPAHVWFNLPSVDISRAKRWCQRANVSFLSEWRANDSTLKGFGFAVSGFSRYRYVESESEDDDEQPQPYHEHRRRVRTREAGRTPARRKVSAVHLDDVKDEEEQVDLEHGHPRPRMVTPKFLLGEDAEQPGPEDVNMNRQKQENREVGTGDMEVGSAEDGGSYGVKWQTGLDLQTPKMDQMRAALFQTFSKDDMSWGKEAARVGREQPNMLGGEDVSMRDVQMDDIGAYQKAEEMRYNMFESPVKGDVVRDAEDYMTREGGDLVTGETLRRKGPADLGFPNDSLPFPTIDMAIAAKKEGLFADTGLMLGRSTRASFSRNGVLVRAQYRALQADMMGGEGFAVDVQNIYNGTMATSLEGMAQILRLHCAAWYTASSQNWETRGDTDAGSKQNPRRVRIPSFQDAFAQTQVADATLEALVEQLKSCYDDGDLNAVHAHIAFWLLLALYKQGDNPEGEDELLRRVAEWAAGPASRAFDEEENCQSTGLRSALLDLSLGSVESAVKTATECGNVRLALLMARALESPKDGLRADAEAQLAVYGLIEPPSEEFEPGQDGDSSRWDELLDECKDDASVSIDEVMILMVLAGQVEPVARFLGFSWYRLFVMELLYGAAMLYVSQAERISAAVEAVSKSTIRKTAPHNCAKQQDVVYHLLRLYADSTASYSLKSGVYSNGSFGLSYAPMDARFSWLLYQVLTAIVPRATTPRAQLVLADEFSSQLRASGLHLWAFYVLCSGGAPEHVIKKMLIQNWPDLQRDGFDWTFSDMEGSGKDRYERLGKALVPTSTKERIDSAQLDPETFIIDVLNVPQEWVSEAKAVAAYVDGKLMEASEHWVDARTTEGASLAHTILTTQVFPELVTSQECSSLEALAGLLRRLKSSKNISNWSTGGGLILDYLEYIVGAPELKKQTLTGYRLMVDRVRILESRAKTAAQHCAAVIIANGIAAAERVLLIEADLENRENVLHQVVDDLERLPCSRAVKLRIAGEYKIEAEHGSGVAVRLSVAYPQYSRYLGLGAAPHG